MESHCLDLEETLWPIDVLEPIGAEVAKDGVGRKLVLDEFAGCVREENLSAVPAAPTRAALWTPTPT